MAEDFIEELHELVRSQYRLTKEEFNLRARDVLANALAEIARLENEVSDKETLLKKYAEERKQLLHKLNMAIKKETEAYERLADIDVSRHAEVSDLKQKITYLEAERERFLGGVKHEMETIKEKGFEKDSRTDIERLEKVISLKDAKILELKRQIEALSLEKDRLGLKVIEVQEEYAILVKEKNILLDEISSLNLKIDDSTKDLISLRHERDGLKGRLEKISKDAESEKTVLNESLLEIKTQMEAIKVEKDREASMYSREIESVKKEIDALRAELNTKEKTLQIKAGELELMAREKNELGSKLDESNLRLSVMERDLALMRSENKTLKSQIENIGRETVEQPTEIQEMPSMIEAEVMVEKTEAMISEKPPEIFKTYIYKDQGMNLKKVVTLSIAILIILVIIGIFLLKR